MGKYIVLLIKKIECSARAHTHILCGRRDPRVCVVAFHASCFMLQLHASDGLRVGAPSALSARAEVTSVKPHSPLEDITVLVEHHFTREKGGG